MEHMVCKICNSETNEIFEAKVLNKYNVKYFHCANCGYIQTEKPYWLEEAYSEAISSLDTGIMQRNLKMAKISSRIILLFFYRKAKFLDYAGGYGIFVRLMRDYGFDFYWYDKYSPNLFAKGFEYKRNLSIELITCFEAFEHFEDPISEIETMLEISPNILFSTELYEDINNPPKPMKWWYYNFETGQHIGFYNIRTLKYLASKYNLNLYSNGKNLHLYTSKNKQICSLSNKHAFKFFVKMSSVLPDFLISSIIKSKVWEDYNHLKKEKREFS